MLFLGMSDGWVALAYCANILVTLFCVIYGLVFFNQDDTAPQPHRKPWEDEE